MSTETLSSIDLFLFNCAYISDHVSDMNTKDSMLRLSKPYAVKVAARPQKSCVAKVACRGLKRRIVAKVA